MTSVIRGKGWGDNHDWECPDELQYWMVLSGRRIRAFAVSVYRCTKCRIVFHHHYHDIDDIFKAMEASDIPNKCGLVTGKVYSVLILPRDDKPTIR